MYLARAANRRPGAVNRFPREVTGVAAASMMRIVNELPPDRHEKCIGLSRPPVEPCATSTRMTDRTQQLPSWSVLGRAMAIAGLWAIPAAAAAITAIMQWRAAEDPPPLGRLLLQSTYVWTVFAALTPSVLWVARRYPLRTGERFRHVTIATSACAAFAVSFTVLSVAVSLWIDAPAVTAEAFGDRLSRSGPTLIWSAIVFWVVFTIARAVENARLVRSQQQRAERLERQLSEARLNALLAQLHPHFLFNTLNSVASLIRQSKREDALDVIGRLSTLLRESLNRDDARPIPLSDEIELLEQYLAIEQRRLGARLRVRIDVGPVASEALVPPLILQPLVENAVRHGIAPRPEGGALAIGAVVTGDRLEITVENDGETPAESAMCSEGGVGLRNTRERLAAAFGGDGSLDLRASPGGGAVARIAMPLTTPSMSGGGGP